MADDLQVVTVSCEGGLNTNQDVLYQGEQTPGSAISLINYEPSIYGGYRRINGYEKLIKFTEIDLAGVFTFDYQPEVPGTGPILGVCVANNINDAFFAARAPDTGTDYLYKYDPSGTIISGTAYPDWIPITTPASVNMTGVSLVKMIRYNWVGEKILILDGVNPAAYYDGTTYTQITHANAPVDPSVGQTFKNHVFLAGASASPQELYFSAPLNEDDFSPASGAGSINVGFEIVQIKPFRDELYLFGRNNIKKLAGTSIADFQVVSVTDDLGCVAPESVVEIGGDLLFLGPDGIRPVSGTDKIGDVNIETISKNIQGLMTDIIFNQDLSELLSVVIKGKSQFRYFFQNEDTFGILGAIRQNRQGQIGFEFSQLAGIQVTCCDSDYVGQKEYVLHGDQNGFVHRQEFKNTFDGDNIFSVFQTPYIFMSDPEIRKNFSRISTYIRAEGSVELILKINYDYEDLASAKPADYNIEAFGRPEYWNVAKFDSDAVYDGNPTPIVRTNIAGSGFAVSLRYSANDQYGSHSIQGFSMLFGVGDRR
jgi:hypothetical protein